jgi:16S rRNA (guanine527-N7)-methyltransferase
MDETAAQAWLESEAGVSRETSAKFESLIALIRAETQNLVSAASLDAIYARHIVDSAQLLAHAPADADWVDFGSGAGFPGLVVAILGVRSVTLVENRALRIDWLNRAVAALELPNATVIGSSVEALAPGKFDVITARAFAPLPKLLSLAFRFSTEETRWVLPKGRSAAAELASVADAWHGAFRMEPSVTDPDSAIIVAQRVRPKGRRR